MQADPRSRSAFPTSEMFCVGTEPKDRSSRSFYKTNGKYATFESKCVCCLSSSYTALDFGS